MIIIPDILGSFKVDTDATTKNVSLYHVEVLHDAMYQRWGSARNVFLF